VIGKTASELQFVQAALLTDTVDDLLIAKWGGILEMRGKAQHVARPESASLLKLGIAGPKITKVVSDVERSLMVLTCAFMLQFYYLLWNASAQYLNELRCAIFANWSQKSVTIATCRKKVGLIMPTHTRICLENLVKIGPVRFAIISVQGDHSK